VVCPTLLRRKKVSRRIFERCAFVQLLPRVNTLQLMLNYIQGIALNNLFVSEIKRHPLFSLVAVTSLSLSVIRLLPRQIPDHSLSSLNNLNRQFYARLSARPDIFLTHTELLGVHCVRFAIGAERTTEEDIRNAIRILKEEGENTLANWREDGGTL
jgi:aromatic-L-amino-acid decarboxylase